jgi:hypothetical protein
VTRNAIAELQHGRRGGGYLPKALPVEGAQVMHVQAKGGPLDGHILVMHHWGPVAVTPKLVPVLAAQGVYRLGTEQRPPPGGPLSVYRWEDTRG